MPPVKIVQMMIPRHGRSCPGDPDKTEKKSKYTQLFAKKFGSKKEQVAEMVNTLMGIEASDMNMAEKIEKARLLQAKAPLTELKETCNIYIEAMKAEMYEPYSNIQTTLDEDFEWMLINNVPAESATRRLQAQIKEYQLQGTDEIVHAYSKMTLVRSITPPKTRTRISRRRTNFTKSGRAL